MRESKNRAAIRNFWRSPNVTYAKRKLSPTTQSAMIIIKRYLSWCPALETVLPPLSGDGCVSLGAPDLDEGQETDCKICQITRVDKAVFDLLCKKHWEPEQELISGTK